MAFLSGKVVLLPPVDILLVAERTDHDRAGPELRVDRLILHDRDRVTKERHLEGFSFQGVIPVIGRVNGDRDAGGKESGRVVAISTPSKSKKFSCVSRSS